jgi:hypothetical protein
MTSPEPKRITSFRKQLARAIPRFPNDGESLRVLDQKSLGSLLIDYFTWRTRYVGMRPRSVVIDPLATSQPIWSDKQAIIYPFLEKVKRGDDLTPHLSLQPRTRGFSPSAGVPGATVEERWADKDMMLNTMGYHHFHPSLTIEPGGFATRTNEILLAHVTRDRFTVVGLFEHSVFETNPDGSLTPERERLWQVFDEHSTRGAPPGSIVIQGPGISLSGHSHPTIFTAQKYARLVAKVDPLIETADFQRDFFQNAGIAAPPKPKWQWTLCHLDLAVCERKSGATGILRKGPN